MGWWFGRKSAPADARPFVPAWLQNDAAEEGFARSVEGMSLYVKKRADSATGGTTIDVQARAALHQIIAVASTA